MEFKSDCRPMFPLLNDTLNYLDVGVTGTVTNIVRNKSNTFVFHIALPKCEQINNKDFNLALLNENFIPLSNVQPGSLLGCLHPQNKKWMRCYVVSILQQQANIAFCDTGEISKTKSLKHIPDRYKNIPVITFEADVMCICPCGKLRHLMENFKNYIVAFEPFNDKPNREIHKKMKLSYKNESINFIIKNWDPLNCTVGTNYNSHIFNNGTTVIIAKVECYDWRHIFVRSVDNFVNVSKKLQTYCKTASNIYSYPIVGDIIAVKCTDTFYRGQIIDVLDVSCFSLYLIDVGSVISASIDCIVDLSDTLKKIPPTVCLVGLKDITFKSWTPETVLYITTLFENSTTMIMEYNDYDPFGLDSVTLTIINNHEDFNEQLKGLLKFVEDSQNNDIYDSLISVNNLQSETIFPVKVENFAKSDIQVMSEYKESAILPGSIVYITGFIGLNDLYVRRVEDHNDEFEQLLNIVNEHCSSASPINRPLVIGEIVGAQSALDDSFYRSKVLQKIDDSTYLIRFIDFGDIDNVPISKIFEIPSDCMIPSTVKEITLKDVNYGPLNELTLNYISNLLANYAAMIIDYSPVQPFKNVTLTTIDGNENVNERINELMKIGGIYTKLTAEVDQLVVETEHLNIYEKIQSDNNLIKLKNKDLVYIVMFINVHKIYIRKVEDETDEFSNFIERVNLYCSEETPIGKLPKLNDIIGAKSIADGLFYRAKVIKKVNDVSYNVQFIDYGNEENVNLSEIVSLSDELKQFVPTIILIKLKDVPFCTLNEAARKYIWFISENEILTINSIEDNTNEVILKTDKEENINDHLNFLIFGKKKEIIAISRKETEEMKLDSPILSSGCTDTSLYPGTTVYMTAFINVNEIYIRKLEDYNDKYNDCLEKVNAFCLSAAPINRPLVNGEIIGARSTLDDGFYRGKVLRKIDDITYLIQYIDFGDIDNVSISNIFEIPNDFMVPSTIMKITLKGIKSVALSIEASEYISNLLSTCEPMTIDFDPEYPFKDVTLVIMKNNENVTESLNKLLKDVEDEITAKDKFVTEELLSQTVLEDNIVKDIHNKTNMLKNGDIVYITAYVDIYNIFVRKVEDNNDELKQLFENIHTYSVENTSVVSKPPELNQIVSAKSSDGYFYRARIIKKTNENNYDIVFIDHGFTENVNIADIVPLSTQLQKVEANIYLVGLGGLNFEYLSEEGYRYLNDLYLSSTELKIEFEDLTAVSLTIVKNNQNVVDTLYNIYEMNESNDMENSNNTIINNSELVASGIKYITHENIDIPQIPPLTNRSIVTIQAFVSLKNIYISVPFDKSEIKKFLKDFSEFCMTLQPITRNPKVGEVFGIRSSVDGSFNRGEVEEQLNENQFRVVLFDLGSKDIVSCNSLVEIPEQLKQVSRSIYSVSLKGFKNDDITTHALALSYVNMLCENMPLIIEFDEISQNRLNDVTLTTVQTQQNVNDHLRKLLMEKEERGSPVTVQMLSKGDIVYISSFVDLQTVYVRRIINNGTDRFKSFLEDFSSYCALQSPIEKEPKVGDIIAAKEKGGTKFYRAEIISKIDDELFNVCFIDFGSRDIVQKSNIVQPSESQLQNCTTPFIVGLSGLNSEPIKPRVVQYIEKISLTETFIIDSITEQNKVILISVNTQCNLNNQIKKLIINSCMGLDIQKKDLYANGEIDADTGKCVIKYYYPPIEIPIQVWVAEKISSSIYSVYTFDSRNEFLRLEKQMFEDSKSFKSVKSVKTNMPCIVYFSPSWYRGEISEVIDKNTAKVCLVDVGSFTVNRHVDEIFRMPSKYKGRSLLLNIQLQPDPQDKLSVTTMKIIAKKRLENITIVEVLKSSVNESYGDLENVGLPSFSSTPILDYSGEFPFNTIVNEQNSVSQSSSTTAFSLGNRFSNVLTIKDVQFAKWPKGSCKTLTFLGIYLEYFVMRDNLIDDALANLENKILEYCAPITEPYYPEENELCLAKYSDELWYRAICVKIVTTAGGTCYTVYLLDWGVEYSVYTKDLRKMSKEFIYLPATAHKCCVQGVSPAEWRASSIDAMSQYYLTQVDCEIVDKMPNDIYMVSCNTIRYLIDAAM